MGEKVSVRQLQRAFSHSILYKNKGVFPWIEGTDEREVLARLQVYHNNVYSSLRDALAEVYTPIAHALGEEKFKRLTEEFVQESPPVSGCIYAYGKGFDAFLKANSLSTQFPWACQAALLCWRTSQALSMEDTTPASTEALSQILPEHWGDLCFSFPKAFFLEKVSWNLEPLWEAVQNEASVD
ncbi:MAG: DUF2063 domain-containing protein, partial [bacterium]|nr:DUF2063 domain-containing protein [bacterium]